MASTAYLPGGGLRKIFETRDRGRYGAVPRRASRVEVIQEGPQRGRFFVDFSLLGDEYQLCLLSTFDDHDEAVTAERSWLDRHWLRGDSL
jgi:hypothetical protein